MVKVFFWFLFCASILTFKVVMAKDYGVEFVQELTDGEKAEMEKVIEKTKFTGSLVMSYSLSSSKEDGKKDQKKLFIKMSNRYGLNGPELAFQQIVSEIKILRHLNSNDYQPCVYLLHSFNFKSWDGKDSSALITSFVETPFGNLQEALFDKNFSYSLLSNPDLTRWFFREIAEMLHRLHESGVIYRDLKPLNIMVAKNGTPIIIDFGLALEKSIISPHSYDNMHLFPSGTPGYMPYGNEISSFICEEYDWYTFGKLLMFVMEKFDCLPFFAQNLSSLEDAQKRYKDKDFADLVWRLTLPDHEDRLNYVQIVNHPYFAKMKTPPPEFEYMVVPWWNRFEVWIFMVSCLGQMGFTTFLTIKKRASRKENAVAV